MTNNNAKSQGNTTKTDPGNDNNRFLLARRVVEYSFIVIVLLSLVSIISTPWGESSDIRVSAKQLLNALLPMIGAWVGTVLAFYFTKDNFETASRSMSEMARQMTPTERLQAIPAKDVMLPLERMDVQTVDGTKEANLKLAELLKFLDSNNRTRLPILKEDHTPVHVIHRSMIDKFIAERALEAALPKKELSELTLAQMLKDKNFKSLTTDSFATLSEHATLADAKAKMDQYRNCQDVLITANGKRDEPVVGWITNVTITRHAKF